MWEQTELWLHGSHYFVKYLLDWLRFWIGYGKWKHKAVGILEKIGYMGYWTDNFINFLLIFGRILLSVSGLRGCSFSLFVGYLWPRISDVYILEWYQQCALEWTCKFCKWTKFLSEFHLGAWPSVGLVTMSFGYILQGCLEITNFNT